MCSGSEPSVKCFWRVVSYLTCFPLHLQVRETETMDAGWLNYPASGDLPDDEDIGEFRPYLTSDGLDTDEASGSGGKWGSGTPSAVPVKLLSAPALEWWAKSQPELRRNHSVRWRWKLWLVVTQMRTVEVVCCDVESLREDRWSPAKLVLLQMKRPCTGWIFFLLNSKELLRNL